MKTVKFSAPPPRVDVLVIPMDARATLNRLEIQFWQNFTPLMGRSRVIKWLVRFGYNLLEGKPLSWVIKIAIFTSVITFIFGFVAGLVLMFASLI